MRLRSLVGAIIYTFWMLVSIALWLVAISSLLMAFAPEMSGWVSGGIAAFFAWLASKAWPSSRTTETEPSQSYEFEFQHESPNTEKRRQAKSTVKWTPEGTAVQIGDFSSPDGMVYVGADGTGKEWRSTIDPSDNVAKYNPDINGDTMHYWPCFANLDPRARLAFLSWLSNGRTSEIGIGHVFIFFYGLERRLFHDESYEEASAIRSEVVRLLSLYGDNRSFAQYAQRLIDTLDGLSAIKSDQPAVLPDIKAPPEDYEFPLSVRVQIGRKLLETNVLDGSWVFLWHANDPDTRFRVPAQRAFSLYKALFMLRFREKYPQGMKIKLPKKKIQMQYHPASNDFSAQFSVDLPDVVNLRKPWNDADAIAEACQEELAKYSRFIGKNPKLRTAPRALALLPSDLASLIKTPATEAIKSWLAEKIPQNMGFVSAQELIKITQMEIGNGNHISIPVMRQVSVTLANYGFGVEPDPNISKATPKTEEDVVVFRLPDDRSASFDHAYNFAVLFATLSVSVAQADGEIHPDEFRLISQKIMNNPNLTDYERVRLSARTIWMAKIPPSAAKLRKALTKLPDAQRALLADVAVKVALADGVVVPDEVRLLEKTFEVLGFDKKKAYSALHGTAAKTQNFNSAESPVSVRPEMRSVDFSIPNPEAQPFPSKFTLDDDALSRIRAETETVSSVLSDVFEIDQPMEPPVEETDNGSTDISSGLDKRHSALLEALLGKNYWSVMDFDTLCASFELLSAGALETINEWSYEVYDEPILDDHEGINVDKSLLKEMT